MIKASANPWADRFIGLTDKKEVQMRVAVRPRPFSDYQKFPPRQAREELKARLNEVYFPSMQCVEIITEWVELALEHCQRHYHDSSGFLATVYGEDMSFPELRPPICLTGLAGTGKSKLLKAFGRLMPPDTTFEASDGTTFRRESHRIITVHAKNSAADILAELIGQDRSAGTLSGIARRRAYRDGWAFLGFDEFQFLTQSEKANTRLTQLLMLISYIGIPCVYASNFSMLYKLMRRSQEDRQRLLVNMRELAPEHPDSDDWSGLLEWHKSIAPDVFEFDAKADAAAIHQLTAGINRAESRLLELAFVDAMKNGRAVGLRELEIAYKSADYAVYRADVELLAKLPFSTSLQKKHKDLWCPITITPALSSYEVFSAKRQERVGAAAVEASLTAAERNAYKEIKKLSAPKKRPQRSDVVSIRKSKSLAEQLKDDAIWFDEHSK
jgi:energy-coupling factor transporter ATP-binding protein EcfA2